MAVGSTYGFETPSVAGAYGFEYSGSFANPHGAAGGAEYCPFALSYNCGIAESGSPWDPKNGSAAVGNQYAFMQSTNGLSLTATMTANITGLVDGVTYLVGFYYSTRAGYTVHNLKISLTIAGTTAVAVELHNATLPTGGVWQNTAGYFTWHRGKGRELKFTVHSPGPNQVVLIDQVHLQPSP